MKDQEVSMKKVLSLLKKVILSFIILYGYNLIASNFNMVIPINIITVGVVAILGVPSLVALLLLRIIAL